MNKVAVWLCQTTVNGATYLQAITITILLMLVAISLIKDIKREIGASKKEDRK